MKTKTLFLAFHIFSATGGIEKVCRALGKALYEAGTELNIETKVFSMYDYEGIDSSKYFPTSVFSSFNCKKIKFTIQSIGQGLKSDIVFLSHINLLLIGYFIKLLSPKTKLVLLAHGVEVWKPLSSFKQKMLRKCDRVFAVSDFTKKKIIELQKINEMKCEVLNNCLDPYIKEINSEKNISLLEKHHLNKDDIILLTLARLSSQEQYKGYDKVIKAVSTLIKDHPNLRYMIVGKSDEKEKIRVSEIINKLNVDKQVIFTGFVSDNELPDYFNLADIYIMPSTGEGFGIVFIEAMFYNKPVIAGNADGSADAVCNGKLGVLINPYNQDDITASLKKVINDPSAFLPDRNLLMQKFSYSVYKEHLKRILETLKN